jgi:hypothetical protein
VALLGAWKREIEAFYVASARSDPSYRPLSAGVAPGSPEDEQMISYLSAQVASGVVGPAHWRIGNLHVASLGRGTAVVTACSYDPGSHLRSSVARAPAALGGGAGLTAYTSDMSEIGGTWKLDRSVTSLPGPCHDFSAPPLRGRAFSANGGGAGSSGQSIWSWVWWLGDPQGPGPYTGGASGGLALCAWHDVGSSMTALDAALANAGLPASFWDVPRSGGHPGIWAVDLWAAALLERADAADHFDLVACPSPDQVPPNGGGVDSAIPPAKTPSGKVMQLWVFWDTVPDPPPSDLPPLIHVALARAKLPAPLIATSPSSINDLEDATIVNFPTWLWIAASAWRTVRATATGGGLVATVWATPASVTWQSGWNLPVPSDDPEQGVTLFPESLDLVCEGPGTPYDGSLQAAAQRSACEATFTQSSFGTYQQLEASISWRIHWALSDDAGVVGGEGFFADSVTRSARPLRVLQVESVVTQG